MIEWNKGGNLMIASRSNPLLCDSGPIGETHVRTSIVSFIIGQMSLHEYQNEMLLSFAMKAISTSILTNSRSHGNADYCTTKPAIMVVNCHC